MTVETLWIVDRLNRAPETHRAMSTADVPGVGMCLFHHKFGAPRPDDWGPGSRAADKINKSLRELVKSKYPPSEWDYEAPTLKAGEFHPLIWRPGLPETPPAGGYLDRLSRDAAAAANLFAKMHGILATVEPIDAQASTFGHDIRELLILASTEVEAAFKSVLAANSYPGDRWSTRDYVKLRDPLRLTEYEINLVAHRGWSPFRPFSGWDASSPTGSLPWYDAYNATKHDRDVKFDRGNLGNMISAMGAVYVLMAARYGWKHYGDSTSRIREPTFSPAHKPDTFTREQVYIPRSKGIPAVPVPLQL